MEIDIKKFDKTEAQLKSLHYEVGLLSKKKPDDAVNKFKLKLINKVIAEANSLLEGKYVPFLDFKQFDEDDLPTNSDVVVILAQYIGCFHRQSKDGSYVYKRMS